MVQFDGSFSSPAQYAGTFTDTAYAFEGHFDGTVIEVIPSLQAKTVTPSADVQVITPDSDYQGLSQVTVGAIPNNYGLITWNGVTLTVS